MRIKIWFLRVSVYFWFSWNSKPQKVVHTFHFQRFSVGYPSRKSAVQEPCPEQHPFKNQAPPETAIVKIGGISLRKYKQVKEKKVTFDMTEWAEVERRAAAMHLKTGTYTWFIRLIPLRFQNHRALIYVYRPSRLSCDLQGHTACGLLEKCGYCMESPGHCLIHLISRMKECEEFPHEVGLFLGYPPEDVCGFIENRAENCKCVGCWKVYGNACEAQKTFAKYKKCTAVYSMRHAQGTSIERLTVAGWYIFFRKVGWTTWVKLQ